MLLGASSALAALNGPCEVYGQKGTCISTGSCDSKGGDSPSDFCPDDPEDIKCCINTKDFKDSEYPKDFKDSDLNNYKFDFDKETKIEGLDSKKAGCNSNRRGNGPTSRRCGSNSDSYGSNSEESENTSSTGRPYPTDERPSKGKSSSKESSSSKSGSSSKNSSSSGKSSSTKESSSSSGSRDYSTDKSSGTQQSSPDDSSSAAASYPTDSSPRYPTDSKPKYPTDSKPKGKPKGKPNKNQSGSGTNSGDYTMDNDKTFVNTWCEVSGVEGKCQLVSAKGCPNGNFTPNHCPGSTNVQCCTPKGKPKAEYPSDKAPKTKTKPKPKPKPSGGKLKVVEAVAISSPYGVQRSSGTHRGVDLAADIGTPIRTPMDGVCIDSGPAQGFGQWVRIEHKHSITVYGHVHELIVKKGQKVKAGDVIATVGNEGRSSGPHLHMEVKLLPGETPTNPKDWMDTLGVGYLA